ncbi:MAG: M48 family metallopeptidase [Planctomycetota bacterium]
MRFISLPLTVLLLFILAGPLTGCVTNPATGKQSFNLISEEREIAIGAEAEPQFIQENGGLVQSPQVRDYVTRLGLELAAVSERPHLPWSFNVLDSEVINAFALPGGKVFVSRGLIEKMTNEAQLAGVLGHEIGHVTAQHVNARMSQALIVQGIAVGTSVAGEIADDDTLRVLGVGAGLGGGVYLLKFGRDQESESDELGVRYMTRLGYNPYGQVQVMQILKEAQGGGGGPEFFATHPLPQTRIDRLQEHITLNYPAASRPGGDSDAYGTNDQYRFNAEAFRANVLNPLKRLPPAKAAEAAPMLELYLASVHCDHAQHTH